MGTLTVVIKKVAVNQTRWDVTTTPIWPYFTPKTAKVGQRRYKIRLGENV